MPLVSIIMPAYNVEECIKHSIQSVLNQNCDDWELIIVNDGSTDNTLEIINAYTKNDSRIRVFSKENGGVSSARNVGLDRAKGTFISFLDSDDLYAENYIQAMSESLIKNEADIVFCKYQQLKNGKVRTQTPKHVKGDPRKSFIDFISQNKSAFIPMAFMYRLDFLKQNDISFTENCALSEDAEFILKSTYIGTIQYVPEYLYQYIYRVNSASSSRIRSYQTMTDAIQAFNRAESFINNRPAQYEKNKFLAYIKHKINGDHIHLQKTMWYLIKAGEFQGVTNILNQYENDFNKKFDVKHPFPKAILRIPQKWILLSQRTSLWKLFQRRV